MNKKSPLVSVIVTTYNRKDYLKETIDSILNQTFTDFELIVVDNYSNYDFLNYMKSFNDVRIRAFQNQNNGIIAVNRNFGIKKARGEYIAFCDDDDLWYTDKLEKSVKYLLKYDIVYHPLDKFPTRRKIYNKTPVRRLKSPVSKDLLIRNNTLPASSVGVKKEIILKAGMFSEDSDLISVEDFDCWLKISLLTEKFHLIKKSLGMYRVNSNNNISPSEHNIKAMFKIYNKWFYILDTHNELNYSKKVLYYQLGSIYYKMGKNNEARYYFKNAIGTRNIPICLKSLYGYIRIQLIGKN